MSGTVFSLNTNGGAFTVLEAFYSQSVTSGHEPTCTLAVSGGTLYGTTFGGGGNYSVGSRVLVVNKWNWFRNCASFPGFFHQEVGPTVNGGTNPGAGVTLCGDTLYGTTQSGLGDGTIFEVSTNGSDFIVLYIFTGNGDGASPQSELVVSGNNLYGTGSGMTISPYGASDGTVFTVALPPGLTISAYGTNIVLTWPTNFGVFNLQSTTNLSAAWNPVPATPLIFNGQNVITNPVSENLQFYRLSN